jgi:hypothetical protein
MEHPKPPQAVPHESTVTDIAEDTAAPHAEVRELLTEETQELLATSKVKAFVGVIASKRVRHKLKKRKAARPKARTR